MILILLPKNLRFSELLIFGIAKTPRDSTCQPILECRRSKIHADIDRMATYKCVVIAPCVMERGRSLVRFPAPIR